jgi:HEPN domain-containing protein
MTDDEKDELQRTTALGLFNVATSYWRAASCLRKEKLKTTHHNSPVSFLYYHAIELFLKAFLRHHGHTPKELRSKKFGHSTAALERRASQLGLFFEDEDKEILSQMASTDAVIRSRYIRTGYFEWPDPKGLDRTCKSLRQSVGEALKKDGSNKTIRL